MCGGTSYGQTSNPSLAWKKLQEMDVFKIDDDDDDDVTHILKITARSYENIKYKQI